MDRFLNNRPLHLIVAFFMSLFLLEIAASWFCSELLADFIMKEQITAMLSVSGGGSFVGEPEADAIAAGEELFRIYGVSTDMIPSLMHGYKTLRMTLFGVMTGCAALVCIPGMLFALHQVNRICSQLEELHLDCLAISEQLIGNVRLQGEDFSSVRRICEGVNLIAKRMNYISGSLHEEKNFLKDFLTDFSHQMKTSLAVVRLNSDMLTQMEQLPPDKKQQLSEEVSAHLDGMETLVISALKLAKLNVDAVVYEMSETDMNRTCKAAVNRMQPILRKNRIQLQFREDSSISFAHDAVWLCEAIGNLLKNAADHGECTQISMELMQISGAVKITIADDGKGIPQAEIPHLFERFGKKSNNASMQSAGVGLAIAKRIIEAHNGGICVYSELGKGTSFELLFLR